MVRIPINAIGAERVGADGACARTARSGRARRARFASGLCVLVGVRGSCRAIFAGRLVYLILVLPRSTCGAAVPISVSSRSANAIAGLVMISDGVADGVFSRSAVGARRLASLVSVLSSSADGAAVSISSRSAYAVAAVVMVSRRRPTRGLFRGAVGAASRGGLIIVLATSAD